MTTKKFKVGDMVVVRKTGERGTIVDTSTRKPSVRLENGETVSKGSKGSKGLRHLPATKKQVVESYVDSLENAAQVKEWSKYNVEGTPSLALVFVWFFIGSLAGLVITMISLTPSIIQACN